MLWIFTSVPYTGIFFIYVFMHLFILTWTFKLKFTKCRFIAVYRRMNVFYYILRVKCKFAVPYRLLLINNNN